jgi:hypothetical protein
LVVLFGTSMGSVFGSTLSKHGMGCLRGSKIGNTPLFY